jgi:hypothetical protein
MVLGVELGPVERHEDAAAVANDEPHPQAKNLVEIDPAVAQQPVDLLDPALCRDLGDLRVGRPMA